MPSKNLGEQNEIFLNAYLVKHFRLGLELPHAPENIKRIQTMNFGPQSTIPEWNEHYEELLQSKNYDGLKSIFSKARANYKADVSINSVSYSVKFNEAANPAIVNHTSREGFLNVCRRMGKEIALLDSIIDDYWVLRMNGIIKEDVKNSDPNSPFGKHKDYLKWILIYFIFEGTGSKDSTFAANQMLSFSDPFNPSTYKILTKEQSIDDLWDHLVFSMRTKGMPEYYDPVVKHRVLAPWVRYVPAGVPRGTLHVRVAKH